MELRRSSAAKPSKAQAQAESPVRQLLRIPKPEPQRPEVLGALSWLRAQLSLPKLPLKALKALRRSFCQQVGGRYLRHPSIRRPRKAARTAAPGRNSRRDWWPPPSGAGNPLSSGCVEFKVGGATGAPRRFRRDGLNSSRISGNHFYLGQINDLRQGQFGGAGPSLPVGNC